MARNRRGGYGFSVNLTGPGTVFTLGIIAIAIGFGVLLSKGVTPKTVLSDPGETGEIEIVNEPPNPGEKGLQLKTLKFKECASTVTIDFLLDISGSMQDPTPSGKSKVNQLEDAVLGLLSKAQDESIVGIQTFHSTNQLIPILTDYVPISYYKNAKSQISSKINSLSNFAGGATPTHDALAFSYEKLKEAIPQFPSDRKFNLVFISDGAPCPGVGCPNSSSGAKDQDPRLYNPNPSDQIKDLGVTIYSLGVFSPQDKSQNAVLEELLKSVATSPNNYYAADSGDDIKRLLSQIAERICNQATPST